MQGRLEQVSTQNVKQIQRLILSPQMQQALYLLQLPVLELGGVIEEEMTQNPLLELSDEEGTLSDEEWELLCATEEEFRHPLSQGEREGEDLKAFIENTIACESSLFDYLVRQAHETFLDPEQRRLAECIIGNLDHDGILVVCLEEIAGLAHCDYAVLLPILEQIQTFDPLGVGARSIREALMIQLKGKGKQQSLAFRIIEHHYEDVLHNRIPAIAKALHCSLQQIRETIAEEISHLDLHPGSSQAEGHYKVMTQHVIPDLSILYSEGKFTIEINDESIPNLRLNKGYLNMLNDSALPSETRSYIQEKITSGKWLLRNLHERHQTLHRIAQQLIHNQTSFFASSKGKLIPLTMKEIAEKLDLHESTIARAVANKYVSCIQGILPLRSFFTHAYVTESGENISSQTVKDLLIEILKKENKKTPLSDETISAMIKKEGIHCARRTVAKYRQELGIGNTTQRRIH